MSVPALVDRLFRQQAGELVSTLTRIFGAAHLDLAEDVVQEAMLRALRRWPFEGIPERPAAWLHTVAHNAALDRLRRDATLVEYGRDRGCIAAVIPAGIRDGLSSAGRRYPGPE